MFMKLKQSIEEKRREQKYKYSRTIEVITKNEDREVIKLNEKRAKNKFSAIKGQSMRSEFSQLSPKYKMFSEGKKEDFKLND